MYRVLLLIFFFTAKVNNQRLSFVQLELGFRSKQFLFRFMLTRFRDPKLKAMERENWDKLEWASIFVLHFVEWNYFRIQRNVFLVAKHTQHTQGYFWQIENSIRVLRKLYNCHFHAYKTHGEEVDVSPLRWYPTKCLNKAASNWIGSQNTAKIISHAQIITARYSDCTYHVISAVTFANRFDENILLH